MRDYATARTIFGIIEFIAWIAVIGGGLLAIVGSGTGSYVLRSGAGLIGALPGLFLALLGIIAVGAAQFFRSAVDTAEMTGHMLAISKEQLQLAKDVKKAMFAAPVMAPAAATAATPATNMPKPDSIQPETKPIAPPAERQDHAVSYAAQHTSKIAYQGEEIGLVGGEVLWQNRSFETVEAAKAAIEQTQHQQNTLSLSADPNDRPQLTARRAGS